MDNQERLLVISNNVLSMTRNNGKTILSCIDSLQKKQVRQLYFSGEKPTIEGYDYYRISDSDIIKARLRRGRPGGIIEVSKLDNNIDNCKNEKSSVNRIIKRNSMSLSLRNVLWKNIWKSSELLKWLDDFKPTVIFFVAGDCLFAYEICEYIKKRYNARLCVYMTDDYVMTRSDDNIIDISYRKKIRKQLGNILKSTDTFFTISEMMKKEYKHMFKKDSLIISNMTESLKMDDIEEKKDEYPIVFTYAGSLYYGRDKVLDRIGKSINNYNNNHIKGILNIYSNTMQDNARISENPSCKLCGSLNAEELRVVFNESDVLVFVESSEKKYIEKTKYSFSTKIPEYLSIGKIILAVGPEEISSMMYLEDCALCIKDIDCIDQAIEHIISSKELRDEYGKKALEKYNKKHSKAFMQQLFLSNVINKK